MTADVCPASCREGFTTTTREDPCIRNPSSSLCCISNPLHPSCSNLNPDSSVGTNIRTSVCEDSPGSKECCQYNPNHNSCPQSSSNPCRANPGSSQCCQFNPRHKSCIVDEKPCSGPLDPRPHCRPNLENHAFHKWQYQRPTRKRLPYGARLTPDVIASLRHSSKTKRSVDEAKSPDFQETLEDIKIEPLNEIKSVPKDSDKSTFALFMEYMNPLNLFS